jgi:hypothetical protein
VQLDHVGREEWLIRDCWQLGDIWTIPIKKSDCVFLQIHILCCPPFRVYTGAEDL